MISTKALLVATIVFLAGVANSWGNGKTISRGTDVHGHRSLRGANHKAYCRCYGRGKAVSICNSGCGNPNQVCSHSFGCANNERRCNNGKCTCKPHGISGNTMTYAQCVIQCERIGMHLPRNADQFSRAIGTGCNINGYETWADNEPQGRTIPRGTDGGNAGTLRGVDHKAYCRCVGGGKAVSICNSGCGSPNQVCSRPKFGCHSAERRCNNQKCTCKPSGISGNTMTYGQCLRQCARLGMRPPAHHGEFHLAVNTGCNINGLETWKWNGHRGLEADLEQDSFAHEQQGNWAYLGLGFAGLLGVTGMLAKYKYNQNQVYEEIKSVEPQL